MPEILEYCPLCGAEAEIWEITGEDFVIFCKNDECNLELSSNAGETKEHLIERWNHRVREMPLPG